MQELMEYELHTLQLTQRILSLAAGAADSHAFKAVLTEQLAAYDQIESILQTAAAQRGWDPPELQPAQRWLAGIRSRRKTDADAAEYLIYLHTDDMVSMLKLRSQLNGADSQAEAVLQKYLDRKAICIRQMYAFL